MIRKENETKIILTFDYELFLGKDSGTIKKCMIEPTEIIMDLLKKYNAKSLFFVDASILLYLIKTKNDSIKIIKDQINKIIKNGHDIGLHLHPQWIDAFRITDDRWSFKNYDRYRLHSLSEKEIKSQFDNGLKILNGLIIDKKYKIISFRAGGYCIQPFKKIKKHLIDNGILYDFSVNPGLINDKNELTYFDFTNAPKDISFYKFVDDPCVINGKGKFLEIPVTTVKTKKINLSINYYLHKKNEKEYGDGKSFSEGNDKSNFVNRLLKQFDDVYSSISIDGLSNKYFIKLLKKLKNHDNKILTFVCHPKKMTNSAILNIEYLLQKYKTINLREFEKLIN